jgi:hypothetical protein
LLSRADFAGWLHAVGTSASAAQDPQEAALRVGRIRFASHILCPLLAAASLGKAAELAFVRTADAVFAQEARHAAACSAPEDDLRLIDCVRRLFSRSLSHVSANNEHQQVLSGRHVGLDSTQLPDSTPMMHVFYIYSVGRVRRPIPDPRS